MESPTRTVPATTMRVFTPRRRSARPSDDPTNRSASAPNRAENFSHPVCGLSLTSSCASPIWMRVPGVDRQVEVDVELVAGPCPALRLFPRDQPDEPRIHDRDLGERIGGTIWHVAVAACAPCVANNTLVDVKLSLGNELPLIDARPQNDRQDAAELMRRVTDLVQAREKLPCCPWCHASTHTTRTVSRRGTLLRSRFGARGSTAHCGRATSQASFTARMCRNSGRRRQRRLRSCSIASSGTAVSTIRSIRRPQLVMASA